MTKFEKNALEQLLELFRVELENGDIVFTDDFNITAERRAKMTNSVTELKTMLYFVEV